jgi:phosphatidylglycerophosphate synthase
VEATEAIDERWSKLHAVAMLIAALLALALRAAWPVALIGAASLFALLGLGRGRYTPAGAFGSANAVTLLRLLLIACLALVGQRMRGEESALLMFAVFALDGLDGWLARSRQLSSAFGARFDTECDAMLVLVGSLLLYLRARLPAFILVPGALRYAYVLAIGWLPGRGREQPRSLVGRYVFAIVVLSLCASLWPLEPWHRPFALLATLLIVYSFGRSVYWSLKAV